MNKKYVKHALKKEGEELQLYLHFKKRAHVDKNKKAYDRKKVRNEEIF